MALLTRDQIKPPVLPKETVPVPELGGDVVVCGLLLNQRVGMLIDNDAKGHASLSKMLAATVMAGDGKPVYTAEQWEEFGVKNFSVCLELFTVARRLSGMNAEVAQKN